MAAPVGNILVTGLPGSGKTTLLERLAERLSDLSPVGFLTREIRQGGARRGFELRTLDRRRSVLAHVDFKGRPRVGRYGVDIAALEQVLPELDPARAPHRLVILDEIGKMECLSDLFVATVRRLFDAPACLLASIALKGGGAIREFRERPDALVHHLGPGNRDHLAAEIEADVRSALGPPKT